MENLKSYKEIFEFNGITYPLTFIPTMAKDSENNNLSSFRKFGMRFFKMCYYSKSRGKVECLNKSGTFKRIWKESPSTSYRHLKINLRKPRKKITIDDKCSDSGWVISKQRVYH